MSDRPSELEFKLNNVVLAVNDVAEWFDLGLQLGLPSATLRLIAADPNIKDIKSQRLAMLSEWLKYDTAASWEKLAAALVTIGENVVAAEVKSQFMKANNALSTAVPDISEDEKTCMFSNSTFSSDSGVMPYIASPVESRPRPRPGDVSYTSGGRDNVRPPHSLVPDPPGPSLITACACVKLLMNRLKV